MGNVVRRVVFKTTKPFREYNLQDRAHKAVLRNRDLPSPKHPSSRKIINKAIDEMSEADKQSTGVLNVEMNDWLKRVYVNSNSEPIEHTNTCRSLPLNKGTSEIPLHGFVEPKNIPHGKVWLSQAIDFITSHHTSPEVNTAESIAYKYKLDLKLTENVLKYFGIFRLVVPQSLPKKQQKILNFKKANETTAKNKSDLNDRLQGIPISRIKQMPLVLDSSNPAQLEESSEGKSKENVKILYEGRKENL